MNCLGPSGIFYIATGLQYLQEATVSAKRSRLWCADTPIAICTDLVKEADQSGAFDFVLPHPDPVYSYRDKIVPLLSLPFKSTLFLDTDACLAYDVASLFEFSTRSHLAASLAPVRHPPGWSDSSVPRIFSELNTGVLLLCNSPKVSRLIKRWLSLYDQLFLQHNQAWDQASFRSVVWHAIEHKRLRFFTFPPEANLRTPKPWIAGRGQPVYVIHGRIPKEEFTSYLDYVNSNIDRFRSSFEWKQLNPDTDIYPRHDNPRQMKS